MLPLANVELAVLSKASDHGNESQRKTIKDGDCWNDNQERNVHCFCQSPSDDVLMTGGSLNSISKSTQSPQPLVPQHSQAPVVSVVGSSCSQKDPDLCAVKVREVNNIGGISKSFSYSLCDKSSTCSKSAASSKSQDLQGTEMAAGRSSSSQKDCKLDTEMAMDSAEVTAATAYKNTRAVTTCTTEGSLRAVNSSNLDARDSRHIHSASNKWIGSEVTTISTRREPLAKITDNANPCQDDILADGRGLDSVNREFSFGGTHNQVEPKLKIENVGRRRCMSKGKENQSISLGSNRAKRTTESVLNMSSRSNLSGEVSKKKGPTYSGGKSTCNNIVSNISSFIPLVQQKQAALVITGKRDIKVKALEAAEAAKRMAEKKENERKMKKEALRLERERMEQHNLRQLELQNRKKEEERKRKEAEIAVKNRQREEDRKEKERKKKSVDDGKRKQQEREEKIFAKKEDEQRKYRLAGEGIHQSKESIDERENCKNLENNKEGNMKIPLAEPLTIKNPTNGVTKQSFLEYSEAVNDCGNTGKVIGNTIKVAEGDELNVQNTLQEQSYEIFPYKESNDED